MQTQHTGISPEDLDLLSTGQAAAILGVSRDTMARYETAGHIACRRTPTGHRRFRRVDVERLRETANGSDAPEKASV
jgi:excisionase family DNA binding protein